MIADFDQRAAAIDISHSCIVQAPAGSGKTELLIQRILALLAVVEKPQQILSITFTNKAAAEMRQRLLQALEAARDKACPTEPHAAKTWNLAFQALQHHGDSLLRNPAQLNIQTIDSFNVTLVRKMPWVSRFGSLPEITKDADALYRLAAERLLSQLETGGAGQQQIMVLLRHLDNNVGLVSQLLVGMLRQRDQWLRHMLSHRENTRQSLQQGLERLCSDYLKSVKELFPHALIPDLLGCFNFAGMNLAESSHEGYKSCDSLPGIEFVDLPQWLMIADLLLTSAGTLRKTVTKKNGFPAGREHQTEKQRMLSLLQQLESESRFVTQLAAIRRLPHAGYSDSQWLLLETLIELLPVLVAELWLVFRAHGQADFSEIALKANYALGDAEDPTDLLLQIDHDLHHILVDEFQDTSRLQYQLLNTLTSGWSQGDSRTLFLVGDPMQSIYRFREAEVGLFLQSFKGLFGEASLHLKPLQLCCNFRSQQGIVAWVNTTFSSIFPASMDAAKGAVSLSRAVAVKPDLPGDSCRFYPFIGRNDTAEALQVLELVKQKQAEDPEQSIAILVRGRNHLKEIMPLLRLHEIPYQAQDIDLLGARPAALDIVHLTRALLHRADRLSWLAVLRAPWCGLTLNDLHQLVADHARQTIPTLLTNEELIQQLSADGQLRLQRIWPILKVGMKRRGSIPLRQLVESCWLSLGGPSSTSPEGCADAQMVFELLETLDKGGDLESFDKLDQGLKKIYAEPDNLVKSQLQIMTIHKAKGLEFDTVIIPGLGKSTGRSESPLMRWQEHPDYGLLLAPVSAKGSQEKDPIYQLIAQLEQEKQDLETGRLLYVATTRAIRHLYLLGHVDETKDGDLKPRHGSMLEKLWPLYHAVFEKADAKTDVVEQPFIPPQLQRLKPDWSMPASHSVLFPVPEKSKTASSSLDAGEIFSGWENPVHRHVGTLVHLLLEQISKNGLDSWLQEDSDRLRKRIKQHLTHLGVVSSDLPGSSSKVIAIVKKTLASPRGKWVLDSHPEQSCELPLTGVVDGQLYHVVIDRTFVADGHRWVIDYKTSMPKMGEDLATFLRREAEHYQQQLDIYRHLLQHKYGQLPIKAALYFPAVDGWYEY
ncbi:ATP-dependent exoDNAse (exonuclease V) beta subunit (contains helicase and exonuclease domains) [Desulfuromusa kysingii]|uniref:DNA 3'-5' helicase n=1 Tax=Desulfuromusa kysingii TaxID=37625 RepID=A0A1H4BGU5_9BACT|nr:UvrD-helicase domain-containing protein [Desulfuromusa kysingii]SEA47317.1 ATP-dependent exoDNAse (exonuclease V) beta subunit (contains helicase and exonuclease domains) [Desulfuromusa kysingii]